MQLDDIFHRVLPAIGPLAFLVAVILQSRSNRSALLWVSALSLFVTLVASIVSAWLGLRFDESHELPEWFGQFYWWATQWAAPAGYAVAGLSFLAFYLRKHSRRGA
jgi:hypothetical protein